MQSIHLSDSTLQYEIEKNILDFIKDDKIMLGRLEGTNNFFNVSYQGTLFSSGNMLENNLISVRTDLLTTEFDNPNKKLILRTYKLNTQNILVKIDEKIISLSQKSHMILLNLSNPAT